MLRIYLDYAATTPMRPEVVAAMEPFFTVSFGNPSSIHGYGQEAKAALDNARDTIAGAINADSSEITFTSGGTEADNLAIIGAMRANKKRGNHLITTKIEHDAILHSARFLEEIGYRVTYLPVDEFGQVSAQQVADAIEDDTVLVSVMHANNEIGTIQPIEEISKITRAKGVLFHSDAVQTFGQLPVTVDGLGVDLLTISSHKIYGPKGLGALYVRSGTPIEPILFGGGQERDRRSGTENVAGIVGFGEAARILLTVREKESNRLRMLRELIRFEIERRIPDVKLNGHPTERLPNNINYSYPGVEAQALLLNLDLAGIAASSGSACSAGSVEPSHVLQAIGLAPVYLRSALRMSLGRLTREADISEMLDVLEKTCARLRQMAAHNLAAV
ncbi:MAG: cysteine desulfurase family protein [Capsulimonadaceae bacterium]|nr:cysteine desulfurase family protein [Capsulimonadaceae bacterium]